MPSAPKKASASTPSAPGYYDLIKEAVIALKDKSGSSRHAIDKYVAAKKGASYSKPRLNIALKRAVESGKLLPVKGSFKLAAVEKKAVLKAKKESEKTEVKKVKTTKTVKKAAKKPAAGKKAKKTMSKKPAASTKKATKKPVKKTTTKKPTTTKKKVVKKSAAKKVAKPAKKA